MYRICEDMKGFDSELHAATADQSVIDLNVSPARNKPNKDESCAGNKPRFRSRLLMRVMQFERLINASRAKKLEKSHDLLALVAHTGSSSRNTSSDYVTHPTSVVDYNDEYQQDDIQTNLENHLASTMLLLARAITQNFSNPINNRLHTSSNTRNQAIIQGDISKVGTLVILEEIIDELMFKRKLLRDLMRSRMFKGIFELHLWGILQLFNATT
nr:hypothetical protein [Tanacetum cinerariifolium]